MARLRELGCTRIIVAHRLSTVAACDELIKLEQGEVAIFAGPNYVLSVRRNTAHGFTKVRERAEREAELMAQGTAFVLYALLDEIVTVVDDVHANNRSLDGTVDDSWFTGIGDLQPIRSPDGFYLLGKLKTTVQIRLT